MARTTPSSVSSRDTSPARSAASPTEPASGTTQGNLGLAISAQGAIRSLLAERENDVVERLQQASQHMSDLIDNLEAEFLSTTKISPIPVAPASGGYSSQGRQEAVLSSQRMHMEAMMDLLHKKEAAMERMRNEQEETMRRVLQAHEETIRYISQGREETAKAYAEKLGEAIKRD